MTLHPRISADLFDLGAYIAPSLLTLPHCRRHEIGHIGEYACRGSNHAWNGYSNNAEVVGSICMVFCGDLVHRISRLLLYTTVGDSGT